MYKRPFTNKFNAKRCEEDGFKFDSMRERKRYNELKILQRAGQISHLEVHPIYHIVFNKYPICKVIPDFRYIEHGKTVVEDVKSEATITPMYRLKKKLLFAQEGIQLTEILR